VPEAQTLPLPNKTRVRVTSPMKGVPEGTPGTVTATIGLAMPRHRVKFDNGTFITSVDRTRLVLEEDWDDFLATREAEEKAAAEKAAAPPEPKAEPAPPAEGAASPADDRLAALAAKAKAAREKKAAGG
jgi:hypothetical protein